MHKIPLFPLNTVLFPKASIPLHVFEDRYKRMIRHCIDTKSPFGVVLIRMGSEVGDSAIPYDVGTTANIINVNKIEDGDLSLEESLKCFERGMLLTKNCQQALSEAEQKVKILLEKNNNSSLKNFDSSNND